MSLNHEGGPPIVGDVDSFPSHASLARSLTENGGYGTLSTLTGKGYPYGSLAAFATDRGAPYLLVSDLAEHTINAKRDPRAGFFVTDDDSGAGDDLLARPRVTLLGRLVPLDPSPDLRDAYLDRHPYAKRYVDFPDFGWWRLDVEQIRYVGGFGVMSWVDADAHSRAEADPVVGHADGILAHMNEDHADACLSYARHLAGVENATSATAVGVDRYGFTLWADTAEGPQVARVAFGDPVDSSGEVRAAAVALVARVRQLGSG